MFNDRRAAAVVALQKFMAECGGARLSRDAVKHYGDGKFDVAWRLWVDFPSSRQEFHILVDGDFPYSAVRIALPSVPALEWPHVEKDGGLCLLPSNAATSVEDPVAVARTLLGDACDLVQESIEGRNVDDFRHEFLSYWRIAADSDTSLVSIVEPTGPSRAVYIFVGERELVAGDSRDDLVDWMQHRGVYIGNGAEARIREGALLWLRRPLTPSEYPSTAADMRMLAERYVDAGGQVLAHLAFRMPSRGYVLMGADTAHGACFGAVSIKLPSSPSFKRSQEPVSKGFRPGHVDHDVLLNRYFARTTKVGKHMVERADHLWIHGRDQDVTQEALRKANIAVLGCGSLGAAVARLLAQAGVGSLLLLDPALMDWRHVGRHALDASSVNQHKADALGDEIKRAYPHLRGVHSSRCRIGPTARHLVAELEGCDLIVSTMGNWAGESYLNELQRSNAMLPTIVYGWLEPHALAAHSVVIRPSGACLRCGFDELGRSNLTAIDWPNEDDMLQSPACGATFSPYGPAGLCWAHALVTETTIDALLRLPATARHRMWVGQTDRVQQAGGAWTQALFREVGDVGRGGMTTERRWPPSSTCPVCGTIKQ